MKGEWTMPLPMVLGHEAAGVVERVGPGCSQLKPGAAGHPQLPAPTAGWCGYCVGGRPVLCNGADTLRWFMFDGTVRLHRNGEDIHHFARMASLPSTRWCPSPGGAGARRHAARQVRASVGCSVMTGVGAVINTAKVEPGAKVVVIGCGGVGLNCVQGRAARRCGADRGRGHEGEQARLRAHLRATDTINSSNSSNEEVVARIQELTGGRRGLCVRGESATARHPPGL